MLLISSVYCTDVLLILWNYRIKMSLREDHDQKELVIDH